MERHEKLQVVEILLTVSLIGILFYFHHDECSNHDKMMKVLNDIKDKK